MSKRIPLTRGLFAIVDDDDHELLSRYRWHAKPSGAGTFYAARGIYENGHVVGAIIMHRELCRGLSTERPFVDHADGDGLNNRRSNLRACTRQENNRNIRHRRPGCTSRHTGVSWDKAHGRWRAYIRIDKRLKYLGLFTEEYDAAQAYNFTAEAAFGEFAAYNVPLALEA